MLLLLLIIAILAWATGELRRTLLLRIVGALSAVVLAFFVGFSGGSNLVHGPMRVQRLQRVALLEIAGRMNRGEYVSIEKALRDYRTALESGKNQEDAAALLLERLKSTEAK